MFIIFSGTTDHFDELLTFLNNNTTGYSLFEGKAGWMTKKLNSQLIIFFNKEDAEITRDFLIDVCKQKEVSIHELPTKVIA